MNRIETNRTLFKRSSPEQKIKTLYSNAEHNASNIEILNEGLLNLLERFNNLERKYNEKIATDSLK
jgi:hypothetical protein